MTSRTSVEKYRETTLLLPEIAHELKVSYLLETSVFKSGDKIRITAQLLDAKKDYHLWSDEYDRNLTDIFAVMSEIAKEIADTIEVVISPDVRDRMDRVPTRNMEAYDLYLRAEQFFKFWQHNRERGDLENALILIEEPKRRIQALYCL